MRHCTGKDGSQLVQINPQNTAEVQKMTYFQLQVPGIFIFLLFVLTFQNPK